MQGLEQDASRKPWNETNAMREWIPNHPRVGEGRPDDGGRLPQVRRQSTDRPQVDSALLGDRGRRTIHVGTALAGEPVFLKPIDERCWEVFFGPVLLGVVDSSESKGDLLQPRRRWKKVSTM